MIYALNFWLGCLFDMGKFDNDLVWNKCLISFFFSPLVRCLLKLTDHYFLVSSILNCVKLTITDTSAFSLCSAFYMRRNKCKALIWTFFFLLAYFNERRNKYMSPSWFIDWILLVFLFIYFCCMCRMDHVVTCVIRGKKGKSRANGNDGNTVRRERDANWSDWETNILLDLLEEV